MAAILTPWWNFAVLAATDTATLSVTATVQSSCSVGGGTLDFGTYSSGQSSNRDAQGRITYTNCSGTLVFELDGGQSGSVNDRAMTSGNNELNYQLYKNSSRNAVFGTGSNALTQQNLLPISGEIEVYGRIPSGQSVPTGNYSDTVNITLTF